MPKIADHKYLHHLTGFRAIAAYLVLITHSLQSAFRYGDNPQTAPLYVTCLANLGMSIFFVLSGFVITYTYYDRFKEASWSKAMRDFTVARFSRLYPLYILCLFCDYKQCKWFIHKISWKVQTAYLTLTQSWWHMETTLFTGSWSVSTEWFFYVCFALWMLCNTKERSARFILNRTFITMIAILLTLVIAFINRVNVTAFFSSLLSDSGGIWSWWFSYVSPYVRMGEFIAGVCAARMFMVTQHDENLPAKHRQANILCAFCILFIVALTAYNFIKGIKSGTAYGWIEPDDLLIFLSLNFGYAPFLAYLFYASSRYPNLITRWCSNSYIVLAGEISYSVYLLQFEVIHHVFAVSVANSPMNLAYGVSLLIALLHIILTTIVAYYSYRFIEIPSRKLIRKWLD